MGKAITQYFANIYYSEVQFATPLAVIYKANIDDCKIFAGINLKKLISTNLNKIFANIFLSGANNLKEPGNNFQPKTKVGQVSL